MPLGVTYVETQQVAIHLALARRGVERRIPVWRIRVVSDLLGQADDVVTQPQALDDAIRIAADADLVRLRNDCAFGRVLERESSIGVICQRCVGAMYDIGRDAYGAVHGAHYDGGYRADAAERPRTERPIAKSNAVKWSAADAARRMAAHFVVAQRKILEGEQFLEIDGFVIGERINVDVAAPLFETVAAPTIELDVDQVGVQH